ncbi:MAG: restriction endonuclease subunit S [Rhodanobacteraceae bacterium]
MNWNSAPLGDVTAVLGGTTPKSENPAYWNGAHVWVTPTDLCKLDTWEINASERRITDAGVASCNLPLVPTRAVVMSSRAPIGHLAIAGCDLHTNQGCKSFVCSDALDPEFLFLTLRFRMREIQSLGSGATFVEVSKSALEAFGISFPTLAGQRRIAARVKAQLAAVEQARQAAQAQLAELTMLANAVIRESVVENEVRTLGDVLEEVKQGIGPEWAGYPVLGATRDGLAPAKEPVGKHPERYKPVRCGTVFYNPMRILIGSIAMVDDGDAEGITSPDYVVLHGREGIVDTRWFYYWLRSPLGEQCIASLARGAVRERMLFNRLAEGTIGLPRFDVQQRASLALAQIRPMQKAIETQLADIEALPARVLAQAFESV